MPSYSEICVLFGVKSKDTAYKIVQKLQTLGYIDTDDTGRILPKKEMLVGGVSGSARNHNQSKKLKQNLLVLGLIDAGFGTPAEEQILDSISIDEWLLSGDREKYFMLKVTGDSMIDAGIHNGDMVIVERANSARAGDIVIASIDGGWTIKYLRYKNKSAYLEPANKLFKNIYPKDNLEISAVVKSLIRKYD